MPDVLQDLLWSVAFTVVGGFTGMLMVLGASVFLPRLIDRMTPALDEGKEIARGNIAVAQYFGRVTAAGIVGASIVIAAAVLGGIIAALF